MIDHMFAILKCKNIMIYIKKTIKNIKYREFYIVTIESLIQKFLYIIHHLNSIR